MEARDELRRLIDELPDDLADEVLDFVQFVQAKRAGALGSGPTDEDRAWLDADLAPPMEPYDWGPGGPPKGKPIVWDEARQAFVIVGGRDDAAQR